MNLAKQMKKFPNQILFQDRWQSIPRKILNTQGHLKKFIKIERISAAPGDVTGLQSRNFF